MYYIVAGKRRVVTFKVRTFDENTPDQVADLIKVSFSKEDSADTPLVQGFVDATVNEKNIKIFTINTKSSRSPGKGGCFFY